MTDQKQAKQPARYERHPGKEDCEDGGSVQRAGETGAASRRAMKFLDSLR